MRRILNSTTALIASLSLIAPHNVVAQESGGETLLCQDGTSVPCLPGLEPLNPDGTPVEGTTMTDDEAAARAAEEAAAAEAAAAEAAAQAEAEAKAAEEAAAAQAAEEAAAAEAAAAEAAAQAEAEAQAAEEAAAAEAAAQAEAEAQAAEDAAAAEAAAQAEAEAAAAAAAAQAEADAQAAADAAAAEAAAAEAAAQAEADAAAQAADEEAAAAEAEAQALEDALKAEEEAAQQEPAAEEAAPAEEAVTEETAPVAEDPAEAVEALPAEEAPAEEAPVTDEAEVAPEEAPVTEEAEAAEEPAATEEAPATEAAEAPAEDGELTAEELEKALADQAAEGVAEDGSVEATEIVPELPVQPEAETGEAPVAAAADAPLPEDLPAAAEGETAETAEAPAETTAAAPEVEVVEEVVTEEAVRSSDEDFDLRVNETLSPEAAAAVAAATPEARAKKKRDGGLSDTEKAVLLGIGAIAIGAMISNNRRVELNSGDRVVVSRDDGSYQIIKDDDVLIRRPGDRVRTESFSDGSTRTTVTREDGSRIVTIRDAEYRVLRRVLVEPDGRQVTLIDDFYDYDPVVIEDLPPPIRVEPIRADDEDALREALRREAEIGRTFSLAQVRDIERVRALVPVIDLDAITFDTGSAAIRPDQARALSGLGRVMQEYIAENPREVFLIEGHTDAVGRAAANLALSDRRAESVALALTEYFDIPPENMVVQGYGEEFLKVDTQGDERANRRASVRRITDLLRTAAAD